MVYKMCKMQEILHLKPVYFFSLLKREKKHVCVCVRCGVLAEREKKWLLISHVFDTYYHHAVDIFLLLIFATPFCFLSPVLYSHLLCYAVAYRILLIYTFILYKIWIFFVVRARSLTRSRALRKRRRSSNRIYLLSCLSPNHAQSTLGKSNMQIISKWITVSTLFHTIFFFRLATTTTRKKIPSFRKKFHFPFFLSGFRLWLHFICNDDDERVSQSVRNTTDKTSISRNSRIS